MENVEKVSDVTATRTVVTAEAGEESSPFEGSNQSFSDVQNNTHDSIEQNIEAGGGEVEESASQESREASQQQVLANETQESQSFWGGFFGAGNRR